MKQYKSLLFLLLVISGCTKELKIDFDEPSKKIVLYPLLSNNKFIKVKMSAPASILSESFPELKNAFVIITENNVPVDTITIDAKGNGYSKIIPVSNHNYEFLASATGYPDASCSASLPNPVELLTIDTTQLVFQFEKKMRAQIKIKDDPNSLNFYKTSIYIKQFITTRIVRKVGASYITYDSSFINISKPQLYSNIPDQGFFSVWNGRFLLAQDVIDIAEGSSLKYNFGSEIYFQGAEFYFSDELLNGKEINLNIIVGGPIYAINPEKYIIEVSSISEDYYLGVKSYARYGTKENSDLPLTEEVSIYSSVKGGYGFPIATNSKIDSTFWKPKY